MTTKRDLLKRINMELWVTEKVGIPAGCQITSPGIQNRHVPVHFTIGDLLAMKRALEPKRRSAALTSQDETKGAK